MTYIPDCRTDEAYNEKYLDKMDKEYIEGFDFAAEQAENLFNNLDVFIDEMDIDGEDINLIRFLENHENVKNKFQECLSDWLEMQRDEMITSMIDNMPDDVYEAIKAKVDAQEDKNGKKED